MNAFARAQLTFEMLTLLQEYLIHTYNIVRIERRMLSILRNTSRHYVTLANRAYGKYNPNRLASL